MRNNEAISELNQAMEKAREDLNKAIDIHGRRSNEVVIASQKLDTYINMSMKREVWFRDRYVEHISITYNKELYDYNLLKLS